MTREEAVARLVLAGFEPVASIEAWKPPYFVKAEPTQQVVLWWHEKTQGYAKSTVRVPVTSARMQWDNVHTGSLHAAVKLIL